MDAIIEIIDDLQILQPQPRSISKIDTEDQGGWWNLAKMTKWSYFYSSDKLTEYWHEFRNDWDVLFQSELEGQLIFLNEVPPFSEFEWLILSRLKDEDKHTAWIKDAILRWQKAKKADNDLETGHSTRNLDEEGYLLSLTPDSVILIAPKSHGCFNGLQTLLSIVEFVKIQYIEDRIAPLEIFDYPKLRIRAFHLDLKDMMPTFEYIMDFVRFLAKYKTNYLCIEYEDKFPYSGYLAPLVHKYALTCEQIEKLKDLCNTLFIEVIPLIQVFGHVEKYIRKDQFKHLQETPSGEPIKIGKYECWSLCPLEDESEKFALEMVDQIVSAHLDSEYIHIGADEVYQLGTCPRCKEYLKNHTRSELYIKFINKVAKKVLALGKKPMMWHDYLLKFPDNLNNLNKEILIVYWIYRSWRNQKEASDQILPHFEFFHESGFKTIGAPSISSDFDPLVPNYRTRLENIAGQAYRANQSGSEGLLNTSWVVCGNPLETQKMGVFLGQSMMWSPPDGWNAIEWKIANRSIQTLLYHIPLSEQEPWFSKFCKATERIGRRWPTEEARSVLPSVVESLNILKEKARNNSVTIDSLRFGLEHRWLYMEILENFQAFLDYADAEGQKAEFPTDDYLDDLYSFFNSSKDQYMEIIRDADRFFVDEHNQIEPKELDGIFGLADEAYNRYIDMAELSSVSEAIENLREKTSDLLLEIFRIKSL